MLFNSYTFIAFLAVVWFAFRLIPGWRKVLLLGASYLFYSAWSPPFVLLLVLSAVMDFQLARWIARSQSRGGRRSLLIVSLLVNLGLLGFFKYGSFLLQNFIWLAAHLGVHFHTAAPDILLPLGISFYTFETVSYLIDVYRRKLEPSDSFLDYALFLTFFPHLVAGPIVRAGDFLPQCRQPRWPSGDQIGWGLSLLALGLFEKVSLADGIFAPVADHLFNTPTLASALDGWIGTLAFSGQIFLDFAGYSTCGIGVALIFGFVLNDNFHFPYAAVGFSDFWRRWHISLSTWLRDYLYIPLGGNRGTEGRTYANLLLTMLIGGLWHGAGWRFVAWGGLHGLYLVTERALKAGLGEVAFVTRTWLSAGIALCTFLIVSLTWVFFRAPSFAAAFTILTKMFHGVRGLSVIERPAAAKMMAVLAIMLLLHWRWRNQTIEDVAARAPWWVRSAVLAGLIVTVALAPGDNRAFIYFQF